ncbi:phospholipid transport system substrate-binding protein [Prosthecobacter fusiformis]|uniref:Phospholipid transport system substrate-binding protein n=1 Tax=Prosthecobacter fusiformis TaxID=48464 RepID=A0A4R7SRV4_9BACT|nr:ABC transporter substrate-binding protein [Prosthecobacter fusiformis]TDU80898.1 phospholipid transport system substrate-binding protein [Prosthecobacter fusiformis]
MNRRSFFALIALTPFLAGPVHASTAEAQQRLKTAVNEVLAVSNSVSSRSALAEKARPVLQKHISFETMTRRAVGVGWRQFSGDQQKKAVQLFTTLVIRTYSGKFTPGESATVNFKTALAPAAGRVDVPTDLIYKGSRYNVTYRMEQESGWRIVDVVIEGVSMVANYRAQLDASFKKGGATAVISSLEQSVSRP